jgi:hypothetical protein
MLLSSRSAITTTDVLWIGHILSPTWQSVISLLQCQAWRQGHFNRCSRKAWKRAGLSVLKCYYAWKQGDRRDAEEQATEQPTATKIHTREQRHMHKSDRNSDSVTRQNSTAFQQHARSMRKLRGIPIPAWMYVVQKVLAIVFHPISSDIAVQINKLEWKWEDLRLRSTKHIGLIVLPHWYITTMFVQRTKRKKASHSPSHITWPPTTTTDGRDSQRLCTAPSPP